MTLGTMYGRHLPRTDVTDSSASLSFEICRTSVALCVSGCMCTCMCVRVRDQLSSPPNWPLSPSWPETLTVTVVWRWVTFVCNEREQHITPDTGTTTLKIHKHTQHKSGFSSIWMQQITQKTSSHINMLGVCVVTSSYDTKGYKIHSKPHILQLWESGFPPFSLTSYSDNMFRRQFL